MSSSKNLKEINADGIAIPNWMKTRKTFDVASDHISSPPSHDDSFFFIRYPGVKNKATGSKNTQTITEVFEDTTEIHTMSRKTPDFSQVAQQHHSVDVTKMPQPCKQFLNSNTKEPKGIDDGFIGAGAGICGKTLVKMAEKMIERHPIDHQGLNLSTFQANEDIEPSQVPHINERRGSRSLPVTPLGSPKLQRRLLNPNPYFTITAPAETTQRGFLATLFNLGGSNLTSTNSLNNVSIDQSQEALEAMAKNVTKDGEVELKAQPNTMRELNFWAPTSM
jgi:hypothetical protein